MPATANASAAVRSACSGETLGSSGGIWTKRKIVSLGGGTKRSGAEIASASSVSDAGMVKVFQRSNSQPILCERYASSGWPRVRIALNSESPLSTLIALKTHTYRQVLKQS